MNAPLACAALLACALAAFGAVGCALSFDHLQIDPLTSPPHAVTLSSTQVELPEGVAVAITAIPMSGQDKLDKPVLLTSTDASILGIDKDATGANGASDGSGQAFVLFGVAQGKAGVNVVVDGEQQEVIPVVVTAPTP
jgi:hypothetical protein